MFTKKELLILRWDVEYVIAHAKLTKEGKEARLIIMHKCEKAIETQPGGIH